jgi:hypothetical protein
MAKKISTDQRLKMKSLLIQDIASSKIAKICGVNTQTVINYKHECSDEIESAKRELHKKVVRETVDTYNETMHDVAHNFEIALQRISRRLSKPSTIRVLKPEQLALSSGIITDKLRLIKGDPTDVIDHRFGDKQGTIGFIRGKQAVKPTPAPVSTEKSASNEEITKRGNAPTKK